jgi:cobalt/nickel transport system permease protein
MHIPDGYLSPATAGVLYSLVIPFWFNATRKLRRSLSSRIVPVMALLSAFCFVIEMINVPLPGGTPGHAVGASLAAIVLGPWPAVLSVSIALTIQALFFGDGGITTLGANCFNMAVAQVFVSYYIYRTISVKATTPGGKGIAAGIAGFVGINVAALLTGIQLGLQPMIAHSANGTPLYAPYALSIAIPVMMLGHLIAGFAEAIVTGSGVTYLTRSAPELLQVAVPETQSRPLPVLWSRIRTMWVLVAVLIILTPLGLLAPGTGWGEWSSDQLKEIGLGFVPLGLRKMEGIWNAIFQGYSLPGLGENTGYILSALLGVILIGIVFWILTMLGRKAAEQQ